jgi:K+-transporting ATPase KdpF subunit
MNPVYAVSLVIALSLFAYLVFAMLAPEKL